MDKHERNYLALHELLKDYCTILQRMRIGDCADKGSYYSLYLPAKSALIEVRNSPSGMIVSLKQNVSREVLERGDYETFTCRYILWVRE